MPCNDKFGNERQIYPRIPWRKCLIPRLKIPRPKPTWNKIPRLDPTRKYFLNYSPTPDRFWSGPVRSGETRGFGLPRRSFIYRWFSSTENPRIRQHWSHNYDITNSIAVIPLSMVMHTSFLYLSAMQQMKNKNFSEFSFGFGLLWILGTPMTVIASLSRNHNRLCRKQTQIIKFCQVFCGALQTKTIKSHTMLI